MRPFLLCFVIGMFLCGFTPALCAAEPWLVESTRSNVPVQQRPRNLWADAHRGNTIADILGEPVIEIQCWVNEPPKDLTGKFILIEVWATWCPPCRRSLALLEYFHQKYPHELSVVSICETDEKALKDMKEPMALKDIHVPLAVDTHRRFANALGVYGIPHAVLIDPIMGAIVWEGMPTQAGYELSDDVMSKILGNLKKPHIQKLLPEKPVIEFKVCEPIPGKKYAKPPENVKSSGEW